jgi:hypothetical protein
MNCYGTVAASDDGPRFSLSHEEEDSINDVSPSVTPLHEAVAQTRYFTRSKMDEGRWRGTRAARWNRTVAETGNEGV